MKDKRPLIKCKDCGRITRSKRGYCTNCSRRNNVDDGNYRKVYNTKKVMVVNIK